jgi:hypothetical protein
VAGIVKKPTLVQGAHGVRGPYRTVETISFDDTPLGTTWTAGKHQEVLDRGYNRCRILLWIDYKDKYITV